MDIIRRSKNIIEQENEFNDKLIIKITITFYLSSLHNRFLLDYYWIKIYDLIPAWDQGYHLSNLYKYSNLFKN